MSPLISDQSKLGKSVVSTNDRGKEKKIQGDSAQYMIRWENIVLDTLEEMYSISGCNKSLLFICKAFGLGNESKDVFRRLTEQAKKDINKVKQKVIRIQDNIKQYDRTISKSNSVQKEILKAQRKVVYQELVFYEASQKAKGFSISYDSKSKQTNVYSKNYATYRTIFNGKTVEGLPKILGGCQKVLGWLHSLGNILNKIPGLKWGSVVGKLAQGYYELFHGNFKVAFEKFCDAMYGVLENAFFDWLYMSIGAAVAAVITSSLLVTITVLAIIVVITIIYFFIGDKIEEWIQNNIIRNMSEVIY